MDRILCAGCKSDTTDHSIVIETIGGREVIDLCQDCTTIAQLTSNGRIDPERVKNVLVNAIINAQSEGHGELGN